MGGFFGVAARRPIINDLFYGTDYHSHLGTKRAGMVTFDKELGFNRSIHSIERSYFRNKFEDELDGFKGNTGIGVISDNDPQPMILNSHLGRFAVVTVAKINNIREIADDLLREKMHLSELSANRLSQTEIVALLINKGDNFKEGINNVYKRIHGSCSMLILTEDGIIAARDYLGRTPIILARGEDGYALCSETSSLPNLGYERVRDLGPGEIVKVTSDGVEVLQQAGPREQICSFLWVYYGFPASDYDGVNAEEMREACGRAVGSEDHSKADWVCGIPDSGVGFALGYAEGSGIPYRRAVLKYTPTWPRSFTPSSQDRRNLVARMKLIPNSALLKDREVVFCDDSIVRGTQLRDKAATFFEGGAKGVHARISCPPLVYSCPFIGFTNSESDLELITRRIIQDFEGDHNAKLEEYATTDSPEYKKMVEEIRRRLKLSSVRFCKIEQLVESIGLPKDRICTHCFDGTGCQPCDAWKEDHE